MNRSQYTNTKNIIIECLPYLFFAWYLPMSVYYFKARITYGDTGFYLFKMIQKEGFNIESNRAVSIISQWIPVLLIKLSAPLNVVMIGYSLNFALIYFAAYLIIKYLFKSHFLALAALLSSHLFLHYGYYYPTEMIFSTCYIVLIAAFFTYNLNKKTHYYSIATTYGIGILLLIGISFIHPFYYIVIGAVLLCLYLLDQNKIYLHFVLVSAVLFVLKIIFFKSGYEAGKLSGIDLKVLTWKSVDQSYLTRFWRESFSNHFYIAKFFFYTFIIYLFYKRKWLLAIALPSGYFVLYLFVYMSIPNGESLGYMECYLAAISVFPLIIFLYYAEKYLQNYKNAITIFVFVVSLLGLYRIKSEKMYKNRVKYLEAILSYGREHNMAKIFINTSDMKHEKIMVGWALPYETLLLSTINGKTQTIYENLNYKLEDINKKQVFLGAHWEKPMYDLKLNQKYFELDSSLYQPVNGMDF